MSLVRPLDVMIAIVRMLVDFCGAAQSREVSGPFHAFATAAGSHGAFYLREKSRAHTAQPTVSRAPRTLTLTMGKSELACFVFF